MGTATSHTASARAGRREWAGLGVLALACMLATMDLTVLLLALPHIAADLEPTGTELLWITDIYGFLIAGSLITMGTLGDRIGRRRLLMIGAAAFGATSLVAAFATSAELLIAARGLLGIAGATLAPSTLSLLTAMFADDRQRHVALGVWGSSFAAGAAVGPLVGGALLEAFWWGSVFLIAVPVMALLLVTGPRLLPEYRAADAARLDVVSALLSLTAVLASIHGLKELAKHGFDEMTGAALATNTVAAIVAFGTAFLGAQYLQLALGMSPLEAGLWTLPAACAVVVGGMVLAPAVMRRSGPAAVVAGGLALAAVGAAVLTQVHAGSGLTAYVAGSAVTNAGMGVIFTVTIAVILGAAPPERAGAASGLSETASELGGALGIALLGTISAAVYRADIADAVPDEAPVPDAVRDTLAGAVDHGDALPHAVLDAAMQAFVNGLHTAALVGAAALAAMAVAAGVLLRGASAGADPHAAARPDDARSAEANDGVDLLAPSPAR